MLTQSRSIRCVEVIAGVLGRAGEAGQKKRLEAARTGEVTWSPPDGLGAPYDEEAERKRLDKAAREASTEKENERKANARKKVAEETPVLDDGFY